MNKFFKWLTATPCERFGHSTVPYRKHGEEASRLAGAGIHLYGSYCTRCKESV